MPWQESTVVDQRRDFVALASAEGANRRELCRRFGISPKTGYKWLRRAAADGDAGLADRSRRPHTSPRQTPAPMVAAVGARRQQHPTWSGRKIHHALLRDGHSDVPAASTITAILKREGLLTAPERPVTGTFCRFERAEPNELWQLDDMGHKAMRQGRVHPLTLVDDHSRYLLALHAMANEQQETVQAALIARFRCYGLPWAMLADNGPPWGTMDRKGWTQLGVWLLRLGIALLHGRPWHPQTQGKVERLHLTLATDVFGTQIFPDLDRTQRAFDRFRATYNHDRPHESLAYGVPAERYRFSDRPYPEVLPEIGYADDAQVYRVNSNGMISIAGQRVQIGEAFRGLPVGVVATATDGVYRVQFCHQPLGRLDLRELDIDVARCYLCP